MIKILGWMGWGWGLGWVDSKGVRITVVGEGEQRGYASISEDIIMLLLQWLGGLTNVIIDNRDIYLFFYCGQKLSNCNPEGSCSPFSIVLQQQTKLLVTPITQIWPLEPKN